jgi:hypothetical protein
MSVRELLIAGSSQTSASRTFILRYFGGTGIRSYEWKRSGVVTQDTLAVSAADVKFSPVGDCIAYYDTTNTQTVIYGWDKDTGFGSQIGSALSGRRIIDISPAGDAIAVKVNSTGDTELRNFSSSTGIGSVINSLTTPVLKFSKSGNYIIRHRNSGASGPIDLQEWSVSSGVGDSYTHGTVSYGSIQADLSADDTIFVTHGNLSGGGAAIFPFSGSNMTASDTIALSDLSPLGVDISGRNNAVVFSCGDGTLPRTYVPVYEISSGNSFGSQFSIPAGINGAQPSNTKFNATGNVIMSAQLSNFAIYKFTSDGFGDALFTDSSSSGTNYGDIIEVT